MSVQAVQARIEISNDGGWTLGTFPEPSDLPVPVPVDKISLLHRNAEVMLKRLTAVDRMPNRQERRATSIDAASTRFVTECFVTIDPLPNGAGLVYGYFLLTPAGMFLGTPFSIIFPPEGLIVNPEMPEGTVPVDVLAESPDNALYIPGVEAGDTVDDGGFVIGSPLHKDAELDAFLRGRAISRHGGRRPRR